MILAQNHVKFVALRSTKNWAADNMSAARGFMVVMGEG
jgi:hypothetical protein